MRKNVKGNGDVFEKMKKMKNGKLKM